MGRQEDRQSDLLLTWSELPRSAGHPFHDEPQAVLRAAGFDRFVVGLCKPYSSCSKRGWKSLPPGRSFRVLLVGYVEGLDSERGIEWRCADDLIRPGNARQPACRSRIRATTRGRASRVSRTALGKAGSASPRRWADATIAIMGLRYPIDHQTAVLPDCLVVINGPRRGARLGIEVLMLNP